jgi:hypothetical protein
MLLAEIERGGALVKPEKETKHKLAVGLGAAGLLIWGPLAMIHVWPFMGIAASIAAVLLCWDSVSKRETRTALAVGGLTLGALPLGLIAFMGVAGALAIALKIVMIAAIIGGALYAGKTVMGKRTPGDT